MNEPGRPIEQNTYKKFTDALNLTEEQIGPRIERKISYIDEVCNAVNLSQTIVTKTLIDIKNNPEKYKDIEVKTLDQSEIRKVNEKISAFVNETYDEFIGEEKEEEEEEERD